MDAPVTVTSNGAVRILATSLTQCRRLVEGYLGSHSSGEIEVECGG